MKEMMELTSLEMVERFVDEHELSFLYVSQTDCSVCHALLPKIRTLLEEYPVIQLGRIDIQDVESIAEKYMIFTAPIMLLIIEQKEYVRVDRFVRFNELNRKLDQIYELYTQSM
ncbi:Thioredoxin [Paenibacillus algorifonticola]|uniref:Thioredoxin n=1 Tax=Paenibacillus algorifonticola TaxID=684063 RepID=A0A1I2IUB2_9BACL|nr:thioredoxin family protein [Paenibacillus algorifonticola]SFF45213.1 Thioredoxin [Paenibacillus algorifonticola]